MSHLNTINGHKNFNMANSLNPDLGDALNSGKTGGNVDLSGLAGRYESH